MVDFRDMIQDVCEAGSAADELSFGIGPGHAFEVAAAGVVRPGSDGRHGAHSGHGMHGELSL